MRPPDLSRRHLLCSALSGAVAGIAPFASARASDKMTREQAQYQDQPKGINMCATCTLFEPPKSCKVVEGDVSPQGWCKAFALAD
ncbi:MAG: hypothetical protein JO289_21705 [Xanthobacteraceae bacterium]|nr:hypothetical protein [Xanthobacteraceae bacterium]